jgi:Mycothiol maleylpyruvate isomerase N-terminal domain
LDERRMTTEQVLDAIALERRRLISAIDALGVAVPTASVTVEGWTAKDVLAHLIHRATQIAFGLGAQVEPPVYMLQERQRRQRAGLSDAMPTADESNALAVAHYSHMRFEQVRGRFDDVVDALVARTLLRTDDEMNTVGVIPWAGARPLWQQIGGDTFLHWPLHSDAIEGAPAR